MNELIKLLRISDNRMNELNEFLTNPNNPVIKKILDIIEKYGGPQAINQKGAQTGNLANIISRLHDMKSPYCSDIEWLLEQTGSKRFISLKNYYKNILGKSYDPTALNQKNAVTLEISALQFFPWLIAEAKQAIQNGELMPGRFIRVRNMKEQAIDNGDILATAAAMRIIGASYVETLDTRGTDGSNIHLGGLDTITGYFGGIGQPNDYPYKWVDEYLNYYTTFGVRQVLNINSGTILAAYILYKLGVDIEFKISVYMGIDNPLSVLWALMTARLFARDDGTTSLIGLNFSNSVNNWTIRQAAKIRFDLGLEKIVRFEHHITETQKSIVRQPYNRRNELIELAADVSNVSAKHEGGEPEIDGGRSHPTDILDYFLSKEEIRSNNLMDSLIRNYLDKHDALNRTAESLLKSGIGVICAKNLHQ